MPTSEQGEQLHARERSQVEPSLQVHSHDPHGSNDPNDPNDPRRPQRGANYGGLVRRLALLVLLLLAGAFAYWRIRSNKQQQTVVASRTLAAANRPIPVTVAPVALRTMPIYLTELGTVTAYNTVTIKSRVDGQLLSVNVREGQQVRRGQLLATIDPRPYAALVAQAEGQFVKDEAAAANSKAEAGRYTALYQAGVVSKESEQVQVSTAGQSTGTLDADRAAIQAARVNVNYTRITSPIDGVVGLRQVDAGNIVHAADATGLIVVTQLQPISVIFTLPEDQLQSVLKIMRNGGKLSVEAYDRSETNRIATGTLLTVDNEIDPTTGTVKAKAVFNNADGALFPNQFVNVRLILEQRANSLVIPAAALQSGTNGTFVYLVKPGAPPKTADEESGSGSGVAPPAASAGAPAASAGARGQTGSSGDDSSAKAGPQYYVDIQNVTVDLTEGSQIILKDGVRPGDQIVIDGQEKLRKYSKVEPKQGRSNGGGPATQAIGSQGSSPSSSARPSGMDGNASATGSTRTRSGGPSPPAGSEAGAHSGSQGGSGR